MRQVKIIVENHPDGYVAYPLRLIRVLPYTYEETLTDMKTAD